MTLIKALHELYWSLDEYGIHDDQRMKAVVHEIAGTIRTWAPDPGQAKICYLAVNEVADRLIREITQ